MVDIYDRVAELEKENQHLKSLLDKAGISYHLPESVSPERCNTNQGGRILSKEITEQDAIRFFSMFWGRTDVYAKRSVKKSTGEARYYTQCHNFWKSGCHRMQGSKIKCRDCKMQSYKKLEPKQILTHLRGGSPDATDVIGIYPLMPDGTCRFIVYDFDNHENHHDFANTNNCWQEEVDALREICNLNGIDALVERSRSGKGAHLWIFFEKPVDAHLARRFGNALLRKGSESVNLKSFRYYDRMLPMQDSVSENGLGNLIALPLQGQALKSGNSAFVDKHWNAYPDQWSALFSKKKLSSEFLEQRIKEWGGRTAWSSVSADEIFAQTGEKPWRKSKDFLAEDAGGTVSITLSDAVYVDTSNLKPRIQNRMRELAAFRNPVFYKNQAIGLSNFKNARFIYLGEDVDGYLRLPRGLLDDVTNKCKKAGISYNITDERCAGQSIRVQFQGELKGAQTAAVNALAAHETGILHAATAFGKTVIACNMIARKKVNTLILLQSSTLMEQWEKRLNQFLMIDENPPEYRTPTGRMKVRKSVIGTLQGARDSTTGIVDIAMVGSLCKKGVYHERLGQYGMVILDECHHAASDTIAGVLQEVRAKYVYGVTATPHRGDGLEKINFMLLGPIRYKFTSKDRAKEQGIAHLVYPRFTRTVAPRFGQEEMHPNDAYQLLRNNDDRDNLIIRDVRQCVEDGRTPVILSRYVDHARRLFDRLQGAAENIFLLSGDNSQKEHREIMAQMERVPPKESMILVGTGGLVGEGFDYPRLDTLIMATPVSGKNVVDQYAGRLNRDYAGKTKVIIYDYVDSHVEMFRKMYHKRLKAYKQIGYDIFSEASYSANSDEAETRTIFNAENYLERYHKDLCSAKEEIIISSPVISAKKIDALIRLVGEKQTSGLKVIIVTWKPDNYGFGDSGYWMALQERMRLAGFQMNLVEDYCEHFCIVDRGIVWYGSMNFLGKEDTDDNLMRVQNKTTAAELLELTFGGGEKSSGEGM